ncbi:MAG: response regulator [Candidatus Latescibacterota bacterium]|nr:response regulator [Candidatus Latescibacterota bacterium]
MSQTAGQLVTETLEPERLLERAPSEVVSALEALLEEGEQELIRVDSDFTAELKYGRRWVVVTSRRALATLTPVTHDPASDPTGDENILVIEDEPMVRDVVGRILECRGCSVSMAVNGVEGLESIANLGDTLNLVLLDLSMPVMTGEDVLEQLSVTRPELPVVVFTGYGDLRHRSGQVAALLPKPVRPSELLRTIRQALDQR